MEVIPEIKVDIYGAVSPVSEGDVQEGVFRCARVAVCSGGGCRMGGGWLPMLRHAACSMRL